MFNRIIKRYVKIIDCKIDKFCVTFFCGGFKNKLYTAFEFFL